VTGSFTPLPDESLADVIWIPGGAYAVRSIPRTQLAVVVDGEGRVLLVDLSRIDERLDNWGIPIRADALFPTARQALRATGSYGVGADDPRIVWKSAPGLVSGTLAPVVDPDTGMIYSGRLGEKAMSATAATDPRIQVKVDLGAASGLSEVGGIVPLGIEPPKAVRDAIAASPRASQASLGAFRLEVTLPGGLPAALGGRALELRVQSEAVPGAPVASPSGALPPSAVTYPIHRIVPAAGGWHGLPPRRVSRVVEGFLRALRPGYGTSAASTGSRRIGSLR